jgi:uncharacterized protein YecE (DUF72 family)
LREGAARLIEGKRRSRGLEREESAIGRTMPRQLRIGCAGWTIPKQHASLFPPSGSHLIRYAQRLTAVEINSSFHRPHRRTTYEGWAAAVPESFTFSVKAPKIITHELRLLGADRVLDEFLGQASGLGDKLGPLLFQFPPSLSFDLEAARAFFGALRARFGSEWRPDQIERFTWQLANAPSDCPAWCIFDNTAAGAALGNVLALQERLRRRPGAVERGFFQVIGCGGSQTLVPNSNSLDTTAE